MYCPKCGSKLEDDAVFCSECGSKVSSDGSSVYTDQGSVKEEAPYQGVTHINNKPVTPNNAKKILVLGIIALCLCETGIPGIILAAIAISQAKYFMSQTGGMIWGQAKVGRILAKVALPISIVLTVYYVLIFVAALAGAFGGSIHYYY